MFIYLIRISVDPQRRKLVRSCVVEEQLYSHCFQGCMMVDWMVQRGEAPSREDAIKEIRTMLESNILRHGEISSSRTLDDAPHYDTNTEINTSRYMCHKCAHKSILNMHKILVTCEKMHGVGCRARWVISALVSESSPCLSGSGWIQTLVLR